LRGISEGLARDYSLANMQICCSEKPKKRCTYIAWEDNDESTSSSSQDESEEIKHVSYGWI